jgi:ribosomal protein S6
MSNKNRYEGLLVLNVKGNEDGAKEVIERLEGEFKKEGASIEQVQKMDRRVFTYAAGELDSGYYVNFIFKAAPTAINKLRARFTLDEDVYRQHYQKLGAKKAEKAPRVEKAAS